MKYACFLVNLLLLMGTSLAALAAPSAAPVASAAPLEQAPSMDGDVLNDAAWRKVQAITGFWQIQPNDGQAASQRTEVFIGYTEQMLYVGVICYDKDPSQIIVTDSRRDSSLDETDSFQFILDGFNDRQNGLIFGTNPAGLEIRRPGDQGRYQQFWDSAVASSISTGIPRGRWRHPLLQRAGRQSLRFPLSRFAMAGAKIKPGASTFSAISGATMKYHSGHRSAGSTNINRVSDAGTITDLQPPHQKSLKLTPYGVAKRNEGNTIANGTDYETGFDLKYSLTPSLTLDVTYNTDFAQVESDEFQVNLDRFSLFLPEQRPFFLENAGQFSVGISRQAELFFSRRIGIGPNGAQLPIDGGVRLTGKVGAKTNVGLLHMRSEAVRGIAPENDYSVARVSYELGNRSSIGGIIVNRQGDGSIVGDKDDDYNRTYGIDGQWGIGESALLSGFVARTDTPGLSGRDHAFRVRSDYNTDTWSTQASYSQVGENFNPEVGFVSRTGYKQLALFALKRIRPDDLWGLHELRPHVAYRGFWNFDGLWETGFLHVDNHWEWESGFEIHSGMNFLA